MHSTACSPAVGGAERACHHHLDRGEWVLADGQNDQSRQEGSQYQADQRNQDHIGPFRHFFHLRGLPRDTGHQKAQFLFIGLIGGAFAHDHTVKHHRHPVRQ